MPTKHFFKILIIFVGMIILGLIGVIIVSYLDKEGKGDRYRILESMGLAN